MVSRYLAGLMIGLLLALPRVGFGARDFGVGILLGQPAGLKASFSLRRQVHLACGAAWSWNDWLLVFADCQFEDYVNPWSLQWRWYYGLGAYAGIPETRHGIFGVRVPLGTSYQVPYTSLELFGELVPALRLMPETKARFQWGAGFVIWF